ncbi:MAG: hypothetical protein ACK4F4_07420 [Hylemonella sp.]|uniref:hypothetical protein n=1 Tax=Hylemonella sp. TaxID=2066020 RepID=UPI0039192230
MRGFFAGVLIVLLLGCATLEKDFTTFEPLRTEGPYQIYRFKAMAGTNAAHDSASAEAIRMEVLGMWLKDNGLEGRPYDILDRQLVVRSTGAFGTVHEIFYDVRVKKSP